MLEVGQVFERNGYELCLIELFVYNNVQYAMFSIENMNENNDKLKYKFYSVNYTEDGYELKEVVEENLLFTFYDMFEKGMINSGT